MLVHCAVSIWDAERSDWPGARRLRATTGNPQPKEHRDRALGSNRELFARHCIDRL